MWMGFLKQVYSFILLSAHVEVNSSLVVSERICAVNAALENFFTFTFCMAEVKMFTGITIAGSLHVACVIFTGSLHGLKDNIFQFCEVIANPDAYVAYL